MALNNHQAQGHPLNGACPWLFGLDREGPLQAAHVQALGAEIDQLLPYYATVGVLGKAGVGKSALCNALLGQGAFPVFDVDMPTQSAQEASLAVKQGKGLGLIDMPGLVEGTGDAGTQARCYQDLLPELDLVLWVIKGDDPMLSFDRRCYRDLVLPVVANRSTPVLIVLNRMDLVEPRSEWDVRHGRPGPQQQRSVAARHALIQRLFAPPEPVTVCEVAATQGYGVVALLGECLHVLSSNARYHQAKQRSADPDADQTGAAHGAGPGLVTAHSPTAILIAKQAWRGLANRISPWLGRVRNLWP